MSIERDAPSGAHTPPRLTPPPRPAAPHPSHGRRVADSARGGARRAFATVITVAFFGVLILAGMAVFIVLPDWVRDRERTARVEATSITHSQEGDPEAFGTDDGESFGDTTVDDETTGGDEADGTTDLELTEEAVPAPEPSAPASPVVTPEPARQPSPAGPAAEVAASPPLRREAPPAPRHRPSEFDRAMSEGLAALEREDFSRAREAFARASALQPGSLQSADGLVRAETGERLATISALREQALALEAQESWHDATERYEEVLELDPTVEFALTGRNRGDRRAELDSALQAYINKPERLSYDEVLQEAAVVLEQALEIEPAGQRLKHQTDQLAHLVEAFSTPVKATLESDELTEVVVYRVGRLGTFSQRALDLRPGTYTVVGSRRGYRDVRRQLVIEPGVEPQPLAIRCEEAI